MHTLVSVYPLCTDSVKQTSLTEPFDPTVIKSRYSSIRFGPPPLPLFIAVHVNLGKKGEIKGIKTENLIIRKHKSDNIKTEIQILNEYNKLFVNIFAHFEFNVNNVLPNCFE